MFKSAQDYLQSQSLIKYSDKIDEIESESMTKEQLSVTNRIKKLLKVTNTGGFDIQRLDKDFLAFSGVTDKLDEVISLHK